MMRSEARNRIARFALVVGSGLLTLVLCEGVYSLVTMGRGDSNLTMLLLREVERWKSPSPVPGAVAAPTSKNEVQLLEDESLLKTMVPHLMEARGLLGNTPFRELAVPEARLTTEDSRGVLSLKPGFSGLQSFLRTRIYDPLDPVAIVLPRDARISPELRQFVDTFAFYPVDVTTNEYGERLTLPNAEADQVVIVGGDSVAFGVMLADDEHLASQLQAGDGSRRFVALGIPGGGLRDAFSAIHRAEARYGDRIESLVYVNCENDFSEASPDEIIRSLDEWRAAHGGSKVILVIQRYVYRTMPEVFRRDPGEYHALMESNQALAALATQKGIDVVDFDDIVQQHRAANRSLLSGASLYVDHCHLSVSGTRAVASHVSQFLGESR